MGLLRQPTSDITKGVIWKQLLAFFFPLWFGTFFQHSRRLARIVVMNTFRATNDLLLPLENRLAAYLLSQAEDGWFHGTLTRTAETLSTSYRQLTRVMSRFAQAGYLRRTPEGWRLEEPDALQALAESVVLNGI